MSKEVSGKGETTSLSKFPAVGKGGKKATTLFLQSTLLARVSRKLGREKVSPRHVYGKQSQIFDRSYGGILLTSNIVFSINNIMRNPDSLRTLELSRVIWGVICCPSCLWMSPCSNFIVLYSTKTFRWRKNGSRRKCLALKLPWRKGCFVLISLQKFRCQFCSALSLMFTDILSTSARHKMELNNKLSDDLTDCFVQVALQS